MKKMICLSVFAFVLAFAVSNNARAGEVSNNGAKGCVGLGLLAGELVVTIEAVAGVKKAWILAVTGLIAAGGGAAGGYYAETSPGAEKGGQVGVGLLAGGMAFLVPTMIIATHMTRFAGKKDSSAEVEVIVEKDTGGGTIEEEGAAEEEAPAGEEESAETPEGAAMININKDVVSLAVPPLQVHPVYPQDDIGFLTGEQEFEYRMNLINVVF
ncbi:MAG: hypothetical protein ABIJ56_06155 [Pseudomonadota bacterium]